MLHELLLSLLGFTGDIIQRIDGAFKVSSNVDLFSDAERVYIHNTEIQITLMITNIYFVC